MAEQVTQTIDIGLNTYEPRQRRLHSWNGIKLFEGGPLPNRAELLQNVATLSVDQLGNGRRVWLPDETLDAGRVFFNQGRVKVIGPPQSGKGTILFGLSEMCDLIGVGYIFIDGHHQEVDGEIVAETLAQAQQAGIPVFFDSTDYLFLRSRQLGRTINIKQQRKRVPIIMGAIASLAIPIAITSHDEEWAREFLDLDLMGQYADILSTFPSYRIPTYLQSDASIVRFLVDQGIAPNVIQYLLGMSARPEILTILERYFDSSPHLLSPISANHDLIPPSQVAVKMVTSGLRTFPVLKDLARGMRTHLHKLMQRVIDSDGRDESAIEELGALIFKAELRRRNLAHLRKTKQASIIT